MYKMQIKTNEKIFLITASGLMNEKESLKYIEELKINIRNINPFNFSIIIDSSELSMAHPRLVGLMEMAMELIVLTPFKNRYSIMPKNCIAVSQAKRGSKGNNNFDDTIFVESYEDVVKQLLN